MCGICGLISQERIPTSQVDQIRVANKHMYHRGPDGLGEFTDSRVQLAMRRLSIIDLTGGWQPLYSEDRSLALIANGEIYNFVELRSQLQAQGHVFSTGSDCETILHLYEEYGADCVLHLRGMFAFALWDGNRQRLMLARDRMGEKPLYLYEEDSQLVFASEMKALVRSGLVPLELDPVAIDLYFHYQYVPEPMTPIRGVYQLEAAHYALVTLDPWNIEKKRYWDPENASPVAGNPAECIRAELEQVSEFVLRSDVPVGIALSGGIDSSAVAALTAARYPSVMQAFSVGYTGQPACDERPQARSMAEHLSIPFHDIELSTENLLDSFPELISNSDEPVADIAALGQYSVASLARKNGVPVILSGLGGDELFWGYPWLKGTVVPSIRKAFLRRHVPFVFPLLEPLARCAQNGLDERVSRLASLPGPVRRIARSFSDWCNLFSQPIDQMVMYDRSFYNVQDALKRVGSLYSKPFASSVPARNCYELFTISGDWGHVPVKLCHLEFNIWLRSNCITLGDRLSMAASVELRLPLLDYKLVETVLGLRKLNGDHSLPPKAWFIDSIRDLLPIEVLSRPKRGFAPPVGQWIHALIQRYWPKVVNGYLVSTNIILPSAIESLREECEREGSGRHMAYKILVMEMWYRRVLVGESLDTKN